MKSYFNKTYQDEIISQYSIDQLDHYLYHIFSIQNIALSGLKSNCVLDGWEVYITDKTDNNLVFYIYPGKVLTNITLSIIDDPVIIDTQDSITSLTTDILLSTDGKKVRCFLADANHIWNPGGDTFDSRYLIFAHFQLIHYQDKFRIYGSIFDNDYLKTLDDLDIEYNPRVAEVGYSPYCERSQVSICGTVLDIRFLPIMSEQRITQNLNQYLADTYPPLTIKKIAPDISTYSMRQERITRHLSIFDGFYNDFHC
jgi:hypothetical protein